MWWTVIVMAIVAAIDPMRVATIVVMLDDSLAPAVAQHHRDASAPTPPGPTSAPGGPPPSVEQRGQSISPVAGSLRTGDGGPQESLGGYFNM